MAENKDSMRYNLVMKFVCVKCGSQMRITYDDIPKTRPYQPEADSGITGAAAVNQMVRIHPCDPCYLAVTAPMKALSNAMQAAEKFQEN